MKFNIRVYGILELEGFVLLVDERIQGNLITKFPGGGLEFGEGPVDCMKREAFEELGQEVEVMGHFYTTEFFQPSAFRKGDQIISIYYRIKNKAPLSFPHKETPFEDLKEGLAFRWVSLHSLSLEKLSLPIDKEVVRRLKVN